MSNNVAALVPVRWSRRIQQDLRKELVSSAISSFEEESNLTFGNKVDRPTPINFYVGDYNRNGDNTAQDIKPDTEQLEINNEKVVSFYIDRFEKIQSAYSFENDTVKTATYLAKNEIDSTRFKETLNANLTVDAGTLGGTAGQGIALGTTGNALKTFATTRAIMASNSVERDRPWYAAISPEVILAIDLDTIANGFVKADNTIRNGYAGDFLGFKVYESNNLHHETLLSFSANAVADDTFRIGGATFKFVASATNPGEITIGANVGATVASTIKAINGVADATVVEIDEEVRKNFLNSKVVATAGTGNTIKLTFAGAVLVVNSASAKATFGDVVCHNEFGRMGAVDMVLQDKIDVQMNKEPKRNGYTFLITSLYGIKTFEEGKKRMVDVKTKAAIGV